MRILTLTNLYPNPLQPHFAPFNRNGLRGLAKQHPVRVIAPILWTDELAARCRGGAALPPGRRHILDGIPVEHPRYLYTPWLFRGSYGRFFRWSVRRAFHQAVQEFRPDVVYAPWAYPDGWAAVELGHAAGLPVVIKVHGSDVLLLSRYPQRRPGTVDALRRANRIVAVSQDLTQRMTDLGVDADRIEVIYDGIDLDVFHPGPQAAARTRLGLDLDEPIVLFIGNLIALKGVELLLEACARLMAAGLRFTCHLIGQGPLRPRLERAIRGEGLDGRIRLHGSLPNEQLPDWYRSANVVVLPSYSEGVPTVLLEAAACGTPFVASRVGGIPEIADLGISRLVAAGDVTQLAEALAAFLTGRVRSRPANAPSVRSREESVEQLIQLLEKTLAEHRSARSVAHGIAGVASA
jgi:glycosyltransferase involved in cell wall biosynthesis